MIMLTLAGGCSNVSATAICDGTSAARDRLTVALLADGGPDSLNAGAALLAQLDAGCGV
jgi:hypothetical protein